MSVLQNFAAALTGGGVRIVDLTAPLSAQTPVIQRPPEFAQTARFELHELSRYDDRGPAWYWNDIHTGEHTGTHFDAPNHWVTGRDGEDVAAVPANRLIAPAVVLDFSDRVAQDPDFLLEVSGQGQQPPVGLQLWLQVRDVDTEHDRLVGAGVPIVQPPRLEPWGLVEMWIEDPDGVRIAVVEIPEDHPLRRDQR